MHINNDFTKLLMEKLEFPQEAKNLFSALDAKISSDAGINSKLENLINQFMNENSDVQPVLVELDSIASAIDISNYTLYLFFYMKCSEILYERYKCKNISEDIYWNTVYDLKYKLMECYDVHGIWGTFAASWFPGFFNMTRFALGRFQYEAIEFNYDRYEKNGVTINKGDTVYNLHIPSSGPITREIRLDSYKRAYSFFRNELNGQPMAVVCDTWLFYPGHEKFLPPNSNILDFMHDFEIIDSKESDTFNNAWRVFGKYHTLPPEQLPTNTSLQKAYAKWLISGGKTGSGYGILIFDGEKIL